MIFDPEELLGDTDALSRYLDGSNLWEHATTASLDKLETVTKALASLAKLKVATKIPIRVSSSFPTMQMLDSASRLSTLSKSEIVERALIRAFNKPDQFFAPEELL